MWVSHDNLQNIGSPLISGEGLKVETSNLALRRTAVSPDEKNAKLAQRGHVGVTYPLLEIWDSPLISWE